MGRVEVVLHGWRAHPLGVSGELMAIALLYHASSAADHSSLVVPSPAPSYNPVDVKVILRYPKREVEVPGQRRVKDLLRDLDVLPETVLVIRGSELLTADTVVGGEDVIELRPVISGGGPSVRRTGSPSVRRTDS
jgi:sulfur carrier protein